MQMLKEWNFVSTTAATDATVAADGVYVDVLFDAGISSFGPCDDHDV
jgi:hypothetical protein